MTFIHFVLFIIVELLFIILLLNRKISIKKTALLSSVLLYIFLILYVSYLKNKYLNELNEFDLNKDGFFSGNEINIQQKEAMKNVISDIGRNFAPITGLIYAVIHYFISYIILIPIIQKIILNTRKQIIKQTSS